MTTSVTRGEPGPLTTDPGSGRTPLRWAGAAGVGAIAAVLTATTLTPLDLHLSDGSAAITSALAASARSQVFVLAANALFATLLTTMSAILAWSVPRSAPGALALRIGLATSVLTNAVAVVSATFGVLAVHLAATGADPGLVAACYTGQFVALSACAFPDVVMVAATAAGLHRAGLAPPWVTALGGVAVVGRLVSVAAVGSSGTFALDGPLGLYLPFLFVVWIVALATVLIARPGAVTREP